ncbi:hypothetical protein AAG570_001606 [Ranatra chinensis]|uniref:DNA-directed RNA polymerase I subunit RPA12 n=1 Tax=Ranatra chinensis TaxID=642074 RepID=A0ABD0Y911_9HEMI
MSANTREPGFCPDCGSILPLLKGHGNVECYTCKNTFGPEVFGSMESSYVIHFNTFSKSSSKFGKSKEGEENEGPVVERKCPKCDNDKMSYATLQLRSADEGQTVFYTCTKCRYELLCRPFHIIKQTKCTITMP